MAAYAFCLVMDSNILEKPEEEASNQAPVEAENLGNRRSQGATVHELYSP